METLRTSDRVTSAEEPTEHNGPTMHDGLLFLGPAGRHESIYLIFDTTTSDATASTAGMLGWEGGRRCILSSPVYATARRITSSLSWDFAAGFRSRAISQWINVNTAVVQVGGC